MSSKTKFTLITQTIRELFSSDFKNFQIPLYQRKYKWNDEQVQPLIDDIIARAEDGHEHYFGVIAKSKNTSIEGGNKEVIHQRIIDGQQRITTSILIIDFLSYMIQEKAKDGVVGGFSYEYKGINFEYEIETQELNSVKMIAKNNDFRESKGHVKKVQNIIKEYFESKKIFDADEYLACLNAFVDNFKVAIIDYEIDTDEEMLVFENLNSKGSPLDEYDLLRNYIISMNSKEENPKKTLDIFNKKILSLTSSGVYKMSEKESESTFTDFLESYLTWKLKKLSSFKNYKIYRNLKEFIKKEQISFESLIEDINKYYSLFLSATIDAGEIRQRLWFRVLESKKVHAPYIFAIFTKYGEVEKDELGIHNWKTNKKIESFMKPLSSYIIKLITVEGTGQSFGKLISNMIEKLETIDEEYEMTEYLAKDKIGFSNTPSDISFKTTLEQKGVKKWIANAILDIIETQSTNQMNENIKYNDKRTIEHIMPQKPKINAWKIMDNDNFDEMHKDNKEKIGNLTFLNGPKNTSAGIQSFSDKKIKFYSRSNSPLINGKNLKLTNLEDYIEWDFDSIDKRTKEIAEIITELI